MKVVIAGNYGAGNLGDELILEGLIDSLTKFTKKEQITVFSGNPRETQQRHGVAACNKYPTGIRSTIKWILNKNNLTRAKLKDCDYFILGGGGLFGNLTFRANLIWGLQAFMAYKHKKKVLMYGQSIGTIKNPLVKYLVKKLFNLSSLIAVRDSQSQTRLRKLGVHNEIHLLPDLIFNLDEEVEQRRPASNKILIALRQISNISNENKLAIQEFITWVEVEKKQQIEIINFQTGLSSESDQKLHDEIMAKKNRPFKSIDSKALSGKQLFAILRNYDLILGMRLHSILSAIKANVPFVAISYSEKVTEILTDANLQDYHLKLENISFEKLKEKYELVTGDSIKIRKTLKQLEIKYKREHENFRKEVLVKFFKSS